MKYSSITNAYIYGYIIAKMSDEEFDNYLDDSCSVRYLEWRPR